ncbi:MAG TPA: hypothetical protein VFU46_06520 [Gemmatimonadales bacterium]|nr:hypothetical protein [Gemmatimonadales bacterium]
MSSGLTLLLIVAAAFLAAHVVFDLLARRLLIVSGAEYLFLGILLGPRVSGIISAGVLDGFGPFLVLAIGWMGATIGSHFELARMVRIRGAFFETAFLEAALSLAVISGLMIAVLVLVLGVPPDEAIVPATVLGCIGAASSLSGLGVVARQRLRRPVLRLVAVAGGMDAAVAIVGFGLLLCLAHPLPPGGVRPPTPTEWAVIGVALGTIGGLVFHLFLGGERNPDRLFISLAGALTLASGAAAYVRLSPLLSTMLIGAILVNTTRSRHEIRLVLHRVQGPLYVVLLIFAGAAWEPVGIEAVGPVVAFVLIRPFAKMGSARLAARLARTLSLVGPQWGTALLGQGSLAVAIALNYRTYDNSALSNLVFTAAIASVLLTDLLSARFVRAAAGRPEPGVVPRGTLAETPRAGGR